MTCTSFHNSLQKYNELVPDSHRVVNHKDGVPKVPKTFWFNYFLSYDHVGTVFPVDADAEVDANGVVICKPKSIGSWLYGYLPDLVQDSISGDVVSQHLTPNYFTAISKASGSTRLVMKGNNK